MFGIISYLINYIFYIQIIYYIIDDIVYMIYVYLYEIT